MGGGLFDSMLDPYSTACMYPRAQTRGRYYRPRSPAYDYPGFTGMPENRVFSSEVKETPVGRAVRTIPVTDGSAPVAMSRNVDRVKTPPELERFASKELAARKIQAVYRGYSVRRTQPLKHLRLTMKVKEELKKLKLKLEGEEQRKKLCSDPQERIRWTEGVMALLLRLDQLQGAHPDVRIIRKAVAKELIALQGQLDSLSDSSEEHSVGDAPEENITMRDAAGEGTKIFHDDANIPAVETTEGVEFKNNISQELNDFENKNFAPTVQEADDIHSALEVNQTKYQSSVLEEGNEMDENNSDDIKVNENLTPEHQLPVEISIGEGNEERMLGSNPALDLAEGDKGSVFRTENHITGEGCQIDDAVASAPCKDSTEDPIAVKNEATVPVENDRSSELGHTTRSEAERPMIEVEKPELNTAPNSSVDGFYPDALMRLEGREDDAGLPDLGGRWMISASPSKTPCLESQCAASLEVGQSQSPTAENCNALSNRALLQQLLEENRKLKDVVGQVLHWGKQQNDIIYNLASRIEKLEEHRPQANMLHEEKNKGRNGSSTETYLAGDRGRSLPRMERNRRKGRSRHRFQLGYLDPENWLSADSDECF
uniref:BAG domain-containing protein n=1 Tax=Physcomitrium patens TaxID=3218 RepID=A0A7I4DT82_PHYPA